MAKINGLVTPIIDHADAIAAPIGGGSVHRGPTIILETIDKMTRIHGQICLAIACDA